jgi:hypothetical protein
VNRPTAVALLGLFLFAGIGAWWLFSGGERRLPAPAPHDDLDLVVSWLDAGATDPGRDFLVAAAGGLALARASDHTLVGVSVQDGGTRTLAHLDSAAQGLAFADGTLWATTRRAVVAVPLGGGEPRRVAELTRPRSIVADGRRVCVVDADPGTPGLTAASVLICMSADSSGRRVIGRSGGEIAGIALDDGTVYWVDRLEGNVIAEGKDGEEARILARDRGLPGPLVVSGDAIYWVEKRSESIWRMPKSGGTPGRVTQDFAGFANLLVAPRGIFWTNEAAVDSEFRVLTVSAAGESTAASSEVDGIDALAWSSGQLYWARGGTVSRVTGP